MKFDNVQTTNTEARSVELPLGKSVVTFNVKYCDVRSPQYLKVRGKVSKPYRKLIEVDALPASRDREIAVTTFVQHCVTGWSGVQSEGVDVPYSEAACIELLTQAPSLFYSLTDEATDVSTFRPGEGDAGN